MIILTIRTDKPEAEIGLFDNQTKVDYLVWYAHRELSVTIHQKIEDILGGQGKTMADLNGIVCYKGPGSFTGLRIGLTVANTIAYALNLPIVGMAEEEQWLERGIKNLLEKQNDKIVMPEYGAPVNITAPRK